LLAAIVEYAFELLPWYAVAKAQGTHFFSNHMESLSRNCRTQV